MRKKRHIDIQLISNKSMFSMSLCNHSPLWYWCHCFWWIQIIVIPILATHHIDEKVKLNFVFISISITYYLICTFFFLMILAKVKPKQLIVLLFPAPFIKGWWALKKYQRAENNSITKSSIISLTNISLVVSTIINFTG